jgi:hypothetical protein
MQTTEIITDVIQCICSSKQHAKDTVITNIRGTSLLLLNGSIADAVHWKRCHACKIAAPFAPLRQSVRCMLPLPLRQALRCMLAVGA